MGPQLFGIEHILYMVITTAIAVVALLLCKKYASTERTQSIVLKVMAALLFVAIVTNRLSQVFRYGQVRWYCIIPDSFCGMTSLVLALGVLLGKKNNNTLHFTWLHQCSPSIPILLYKLCGSFGQFPRRSHMHRCLSYPANTHPFQRVLRDPCIGSKSDAPAWNTLGTDRTGAVQESALGIAASPPNSPFRF